MLGRRVILSAIAIVGVTALNIGAGMAQTYPNRPVKIVIPFAPGGPTEFILRLIADRLQARLGQPFVVENRPGGAGGTVGAKSVAIAEPDGYTLLFSSPGPLVTAAAIYKNLDYDPIKSFAPIAMVIYSPQMLVVHPALPVNSWPELVAYAKANPKKVTFASSGYGTQPHMLGEMLKLLTGIDIVHVPYRGAGQSVGDLVAGQVQMIFETFADPAAAHRGRQAAAARRRGRGALAVICPRCRPPSRAAIPTLLASFWSGLLAPAGTPPAIVDNAQCARSTTSCDRRRRRPGWRG